MSELIHIGINAVALNMTGEYIIVDDDTGRIVIPLSDAPAIAAAIAKLAGEPDAVAVVERLIEAASALERDMMERAQAKMDVIHGEQYRIVNAGRTAWSGFTAALTAARDWRNKQGAKE